MLMPPERVPVLLKTRLLAICRLCAQAWTKMPPPPWELSVMPMPSILDGLHRKLLGYWLAPPAPPAQFATVSSVVPDGKEASAPDPNASEELGGMLTPFPSTVTPAPS